jgi:hypothetical protein
MSGARTLLRQQIGILIPSSRSDGMGGFTMSYAEASETQRGYRIPITAPTEVFMAGAVESGELSHIFVEEHPRSIEASYKLRTPDDRVWCIKSLIKLPNKIAKAVCSEDTR